MPLAAPKLRVDLCGWFVAASYTWRPAICGTDASCPKKNAPADTRQEVK